MSGATDDVRWLIARELPGLRRFARALRGDSTADDLVQDCLERALRKHMLWQRGTNMRAWLFRILYNLHLSGLRHQKRDPATVPLEDVNGWAGASGTQVDHVELLEIAKSLQQLPREQREVINLVALEGLRYDEAADILGINLGTVRSRLSRGRSALRDSLTASLARADGESVQGRGTSPPHLRRVK